jgi:hypothetical protein
MERGVKRAKNGDQGKENVVMLQCFGGEEEGGGAVNVMDMAVS